MLVVEAGTVPQRVSSTSDHRFTMLPFTSASGEAVCYVLIFQSDTGEVPSLWQHGHDKTVPLVRDNDGTIILEANLGDGKAYPGGPSCEYNGKVIPCLTYASKSGGITGDILVAVLTEFDARDMFPRRNGLMPALVVDGHQSRLDPAFVEYINNPAHRWKVCLGVPYATSLWQVGDASEQNGRAKTMWYREKARFTSWKLEHHLPCKIDACDIVPLVNKLFHECYGNVALNKKATADRGWFPANRALVEHPSLSHDEEPAVEDLALNVADGLGAAALDRIIAHRARSEGGKKAAEKRMATKEGVSKNILETRKLTAGVITGNGVHSLDDPWFLVPYHERRRRKREKEDKLERTKRAKSTKDRDGVRAMRTRRGHERTHLFAKCTSQECGAYLQYKKNQGKGGKPDGAMPKDLADRRARCVEYMSRPSPSGSPCQSDNEDNEDSEDTAMQSANALLALAAHRLDAGDDLGMLDGDGHPGESDGEDDVCGGRWQLGEC